RTRNDPQFREPLLDFRLERRPQPGAARGLQRSRHCARQYLGCRSRSPETATPSFSTSTYSAPASAVATSRAPAASQRATTSARGKPQRFLCPAETSANCAPVASTSAGVDDVALP